MKAVVAAFNQEKALVGAFSVITNLRMELFQALSATWEWVHLLIFANIILAAAPVARTRIVSPHEVQSQGDA